MNVKAIMNAILKDEETLLSENQLYNYIKDYDLTAAEMHYLFCEMERNGIKVCID